MELRHPNLKRSISKKDMLQKQKASCLKRKDEVSKLAVGVFSSIPFTDFLNSLF